jgi:hypothetical protein
LSPAGKSASLNFLPPARYFSVKLIRNAPFL